jgi:hypothetical protein
VPTKPILRRKPRSMQSESHLKIWTTASSYRSTRRIDKTSKACRTKSLRKILLARVRTNSANKAARIRGLRGGITAKGKLKKVWRQIWRQTRMNDCLPFQYFLWHLSGASLHGKGTLREKPIRSQCGRCPLALCCDAGSEMLESASAVDCVSSVLAISPRVTMPIRRLSRLTTGRRRT